MLWLFGSVVTKEGIWFVCWGISVAPQCFISNWSFETLMICISAFWYHHINGKQPDRFYLMSAQFEVIRSMCLSFSESVLCWVTCHCLFCISDMATLFHPLSRRRRTEKHRRTPWMTSSPMMKRSMAKEVRTAIFNDWTQHYNSTHP